MHTAWQKMNHVFAIRRSGESCPLPSGPKVVNGCPNFPRALLDQHPVDLLVIEQCSQSESLPTGAVYSWETAIGKTKIDNRPQVILESWGTACTTWSRGPVTKECITRWSQMGYETSLKLLRGLDVGSATRHNRVMVVRIRKDVKHRWHWPSVPLETPVRTMSNLLTPPGLVPKYKYIKKPKGRSVCALSDPMPIHPGALIRTERGVRGLLLDEFCRGLGYLKSEAAEVSQPVAMRTTPVFHWEFLSTALSGCPAKVAVPLSTTTESPQGDSITKRPTKGPVQLLLDSP